jgi:hypothetical protein
MPHGGSYFQECSDVLNFVEWRKRSLLSEIKPYLIIYTTTKNGSTRTAS